MVQIVTQAKAGSRGARPVQEKFITGDALFTVCQQSAAVLKSIEISAKISKYCL